MTLLFIISTAFSLFIILSKLLIIQVLPSVVHEFFFSHVALYIDLARSNLSKSQLPTARMGQLVSTQAPRLIDARFSGPSWNKN